MSSLFGVADHIQLLGGADHAPVGGRGRGRRARELRRAPHLQGEGAGEGGGDGGTPIKLQDLLRYYYYIHNGIATKYVAGMSQEWFQRIMNLVPKYVI